MMLLETIKKASIDHETLTSQSKYPIILNTDDIFRNLTPQNDDSSDISLIKNVKGWRISELDSEIIELGNQFCKKLKRKLKKVKSLEKEEFLGLLNSFLEKNRERIGISVELDPSDADYTRVMIEKVGFLIAKDVGSLILEGCLVLELWELLETLIREKIVANLSSSNLIESLIEKKRSDLICLCIKYFSEIGSSDIRSILKYFLSPPKGACGNMVSVKKEWESEALLAVDKAKSRKLSDEKYSSAKQASILLMIAYDGFSLSELCMHYLFASLNLDELILSNAISRLDGYEMLKLIRYMGKWVRKYEKFPQAAPCPNAASALGLRSCEWVPSLDCVVRCIGVVLDERFSSLVLSTEFHEELRSLEEDVKSLTAEAKISCLVADVVQNLKAESELQ